MPFERYLDPHPPEPHGYDHAGHPAHGDHVASTSAAALPSDSPTFSTHVHFQMPQLILGAPTLAPGGGAEVLPAGYVGTSALSSTWFPNSHFYPPQNDFSSTSASAHYAATQYASPKPVYPTSGPSIDYLESDARHSPLPGHPNAYPYPPEPASSAAAPSSVPAPSMPTALPSALGLPIYSTSGFDLLDLLARVASRPNPRIVLGPVDMTCSFVVVDVAGYDSPIVYASPTFCALTGYSEQDVLGRNCRFLQAPGGQIRRGDARQHTSADAVSLLRRSISANKECQTSIINYRKDGTHFINLVTVIPVPDDALDEPRYYVGFQVDLGQQPGAILQKIRNGSYYMVNYSAASSSAHVPRGARDWRTAAATMPGTSSALRALLADPGFLASFSLSASASAAVGAPAGERLDACDGSQPLHLALLEAAPDFVHVVSLKGAFLYVAPAVRAVLGYSPAELVGRGIADVCHPADVVPLMRELKESSVVHGPGSSAARDTPASASAPATARPRPVDLLFRVRAKSGEFVWLECRGRLHVEPGKGRKAIILSGRVRAVPRLAWRAVAHAGGLALPAPHASHASNANAQDEDGAERECWALLSAHGTVLYAGAAVRDVLGWGAGEVIGRALGDFLGGAAADVRAHVEDALARADRAAPAAPCTVPCELQRRDGALVPAHIVIYPQDGPAAASSSAAAASTAAARASCPVVCQIRLADASGAAAPRIVHAPGESVFAELQIARGSSWQYELQQLKFANQRLQEEVALLEDAVRARARRVSHSAHSVRCRTSSSSHTQAGPRAPLLTRQPLVAHTSVDQHDMRDYRLVPRASHPAPRSTVPYPDGQAWLPPYTYNPPYAQPSAHQMPMKRSWDAMRDGGPT